jgi:hypothetical protein
MARKKSKRNRKTKDKTKNGKEVLAELQAKGLPFTAAGNVDVAALEEAASAPKYKLKTVITKDVNVIPPAGGAVLVPEARTDPYQAIHVSNYNAAAGFAAVGEKVLLSGTVLSRLADPKVQAAITHAGYEPQDIIAAQKEIERNSGVKDAEVEELAKPTKRRATPVYEEEEDEEEEALSYNDMKQDLPTPTAPNMAAFVQDIAEAIADEIAEEFNANMETFVNAVVEAVTAEPEEEEESEAIEPEQATVIFEGDFGRMTANYKEVAIDGNMLCLISKANAEFSYEPPMSLDKPINVSLSNGKEFKVYVLATGIPILSAEGVMTICTIESEQQGVGDIEEYEDTTFA